MTSKEALEIIQDNLTPRILGILTVEFNIVEKDLERLETLEKECSALEKEIETKNAMLSMSFELKQENEKLKQQVKDLENNQETVLTTLEISVQQNKKLKKAIEILKKFNFKLGQYGNGEYYILIYYASITIEIILTQQEYELLKEVLGNEI